MKIHEYQAAGLMKQYGIAVPPGRVASEVYDAVLIAEEVKYPVVLKAQVHVGGRGKAGGIKIAKTKKELEEHFTALRKMSIKGYPVEKVYVVKAIDIREEFYLSITVDPARDDLVVIASAEGGVEIEQTAKDRPDAVDKIYFEGRLTFDEERWAACAEKMFRSDKHKREATEILRNLVKLFVDNDCSLAEINPLVVDGNGRVIAADAKVNLDDNGLYRHPELEDLRDKTYEDPDEFEAKAHNLSFVKLEGNVGCIVNGAGLAMATMDIVQLEGGRPANFLDVGGSSNPEKVLNALRIILRNPEVDVILINIFGGITRCDDIANGILEARRQLDLSVPLVVRLTGTNEEEAKKILGEAGIKTYSSMREAVRNAVRLTKKS